ncbi:GntR family transcriptional regulator [Actinomadura macra]|uniref:GntR family transcriptional regulator n=1 Tax=Actinomadura macra TaxID=46164 RepID=UPI0009FE59FD|nr:GntR family transcriptional regulator [Actinomadura macra]
MPTLAGREAPGTRGITTRPGRAPWGTYRQIAQVLRQRIVSGTYPDGSVMPSEKEMCIEFGVVRGTVRHALGLLRDEELVVPRKGVGWSVTSGDGRPAFTRYERVASQLRSWVEGAEPGAMLPGESEICRQYGVSRATTRRALRLLEADGLVGVVRGIGRVVLQTSSEGP